MEEETRFKIHEASKNEIPKGLILDKKNPLFVECPD